MIPVLPCTCPDAWCQQHARCRCGSDLIIDDPDSLAFCPACLMDVMPVGGCSTTSHSPAERSNS